MDECEKTINKFFTLKEGNYYQKMAFIHLLADQFKKFCMSQYLDPKILKHNDCVKHGLFRRKHLRDVRHKGNPVEMERRIIEEINNNK